MQSKRKEEKDAKLCNKFKVLEGSPTEQTLVFIHSFVCFADNKSFPFAQNYLISKHQTFSVLQLKIVPSNL